MDTENKAFLPYFISEEIYSIETTEVVAINDSVESLAEDAQVTYNMPSEPKNELKIEGKNNKSVLILINYSNGIPENERTFLFKILSAINLTQSDIALIDLGINKTPEQHKLVSQLSCKMVIAFGADFESMFPNETPSYKLTQMKSCEVIKSDSLIEVMNDTSKKKLLWEQLKSFIQS